MSHPRRRLSRLLSESRGGALVLALMVLVGLSAITLALLSIAALEPQISRNHVDMVAARYLAESGVEHAYDTLVSNTGTWNQYLTGATCAAGAVLADARLPSERTRSDGRFTVLLRNDCASGDERITGVPPDTADPTHDGNGKLVVVSTGIVRQTSHTITAVISDERETRDPGQSVSRIDVKSYNWADR